MVTYLAKIAQEGKVQVDVSLLIQFFPFIFQQVTDHETWIYNLTEANQGSNTPRWFKEYSFKQEYNVPNLSPASLDQLTKNFVRDDQLLLKYWRNYVKMGDPHLEQGCDQGCLFNTYCRIVTTEYFDKSKCDEFYRYRFTGA